MFLREEKPLYLPTIADAPSDTQAVILFYQDIIDIKNSFNKSKIDVQFGSRNN